jgi:ABC-type transport system substrate-binding protein
MRKTTLLATFALIASLLVAACGSTAEESASPTPTPEIVEGGTLLIGDYQDADSLNPFYYSTVMSSNIVGATHDGLLRLNENLLLEPWMAYVAPSVKNKGIRLGDDADAGDAATVTWYLRPWKWSDGVDLTCADYQFAREWIMDEANTAVSKVGTEDISAIDCAAGTGKDGREGETMTVHYSNIYQNLKYGPAVAPAHYYSKFTLEEVAEDANPVTDVSTNMLLGAGYRTKDLPNVPTSGAFHYESRTVGIETVVVRNKYWSDPRTGEQAKLARIKFIVCGAPSTCVAKFRAGELDMATDLDGSQYDPTEDLGDQRKTLNAFTVEFLRPNFSETVCSDGAPAGIPGAELLPDRDARGGGCPASDLAIRQAISYAVDRTQYLNKIEGGIGSIATNMELPDFFFYKEIDLPLKKDLAAAEAALAAGGWEDTNGNDIVDKDIDGDGDQDEAIIDFCTTLKPTRGAKLQLLVAELAEIGIVGIVDAVPSGTLFGTLTDTPANTKCNLAQGSFDVALHAFGIPSIEPSGYDSYHSTQTEANGGGNDQFVNIPKLDELLEAVKTSVDVPVQKKLMYKVQDVMTENVVTIPLHYWLDITLVSNNVSGYIPHQAWGPVWNAYELDVTSN